MTKQEICKIYEALMLTYPDEARAILLHLLSRIRQANL